MRADQAQLTQVVRAEPADAFALAALELQLAREGGGRGEEGFLIRYADAWLAERERRPAWIAKSLDGRPLGATTLVVVEGLPRPGRHSRPWVHITGLYVAQSVRRAGLGERLLRAGLEWSREHHAVWVQSPAHPTCAGLFRRAGFTAAEQRLWRLDLP